MKNNNITLLSLFIFTVFITSCATSGQRLGFSKAEWEHMDSKKRKEFLSHYKQVSSSKAKENKNTPENDSNNNKNTTGIHVLIMGGKAMMPPFTQAYSYQPVSFVIQEGSCKQVILQQKTEDTDKHKHSVEMEVCFKNNILLLDPSRYDANKSDSSARLYRSPLWRRGFSYPHINSTGYARLQDVMIKIHN